MKITILVDNPKSWYVPYARELVKKLASHDVLLVHTIDEVPVGDCAFFLSCERLIKSDVRSRNKHNLVVHSSPLPKGKGWSPLTWQILEGNNSIVSTLFEAVDAVDAGVVYGTDTVHFAGHELLPELHAGQAASIEKLVLTFVENYDTIKPTEQSGEETFYRKRKPEDSELDINKTISEQFNLLRVVDNEKYPAYFKINGHTYKLQITKLDPNP